MQAASSSASVTNFEMFLIHRPQHCLSLSPREAVSCFGQVIDACPNSRTSDSLIPLQIQIYMLSIPFKIFRQFENDNGYHF